jgi:hypothetical protein
MTIYTYDLTNDFPNGIDQLCLHHQVENHGFPNEFNGVHIYYDQDEVVIDFVGSLGQSDEDDLDTIIANHDPQNTVECEQITTDVGEVIGAAGDVSSEDLSQTTSKNPVQKLRMNLTDIQAGRYRIGWYYEWSHSSTSRDFRARVQLNDSIDLMYHSQEIKDWGTDQSVPVCGFSYQDLDDGDHFIDLDFWAEGFTAYIQNAKLEIWRVS